MVSAYAEDDNDSNLNQQDLLLCLLQAFDKKEFEQCSGYSPENNVCGVRHHDERELPAPYAHG